MNGGSGIRRVEHWDAFWRARDKAVSQEDADHLLNHLLFVDR